MKMKSGNDPKIILMVFFTSIKIKTSQQKVDSWQIEYFSIAPSHRAQHTNFYKIGVWSGIKEIQGRVLSITIRKSILLYRVVGIRKSRYLSNCRPQSCQKTSFWYRFPEYYELCYILTQVQSAAEMNSSTGMDYLQNHIQCKKKVGYESEGVFLCDVTIRNYLFLKL